MLVKVTCAQCGETYTLDGSTTAPQKCPNCGSKEVKI